MYTDPNLLKAVILKQSDLTIGQHARHFYANHPLGREIKNCEDLWSGKIDSATDEALGRFIRHRLINGCLHELTYTYWIFDRLELPKLGKGCTDLEALTPYVRAIYDEHLAEWKLINKGDLADHWEAIQAAEKAAKKETTGNEKLDLFHQAEASAIRCAFRCFLEPVLEEKRKRDMLAKSDDFDLADLASITE